MKQFFCLKLCFLMYEDEELITLLVILMCINYFDVLIKPKKGTVKNFNFLIQLIIYNKFSSTL